jgi:hypothetical protein
MLKKSIEEILHVYGFGMLTMHGWLFAGGGKRGEVRHDERQAHRRRVLW